MKVSVTEDINGMKYVRVTPDTEPKTLKTTEQIAQEREMYDEIWEDWIRLDKR